MRPAGPQPTRYQLSAAQGDGLLVRHSKMESHDFLASGLERVDPIIQPIYTGLPLTGANPVRATTTTVLCDHGVRPQPGRPKVTEEEAGGQGKGNRISITANGGWAAGRGKVRAPEHGFPATGVSRCQSEPRGGTPAPEETDRRGTQAARTQTFLSQKRKHLFACGRLPRVSTP